MRLSLRQFLFDSPSDDQSFGDVFKRRLVQKEVVVLKHETRALADPQNVVAGDLGQVKRFARKGQPTAVGFFQEIQAT